MLIKKIILLLSTFIIPLVAFTQNLSVQTSQVKYKKGTYPCVEANIEPGTDEVKEAWEDFIKDKYDVKMKGTGLFTNKDVLHAEQVVLKAISTKEIDFYTKVVEEGDHTKMCVFGAFGYDIPISEKEYPAEFAALENVTKRFLKGYLPGYYNEWIENTKSSLSDLEEDRDDMRDELEENKEEIASLQKENKELEKKD